MADPQAVARRLQEFLAWEWKRPIESFHEAVPENFDMVALNGLRPMDPTRAGRWKGDEHRERIEQILREIPELPQYLIDEGYENDTAWATDYGRPAPKRPWFA